MSAFLISMVLLVLGANGSPSPFQLEHHVGRGLSTPNYDRLVSRQAPLVVNETAIAMEACVNLPQNSLTNCIAEIESSIEVSSGPYCQIKYSQVNACYVFNNNDASACASQLFDYQNCIAYTALVYQYCIEYYHYYESTVPSRVESPSPSDTGTGPYACNWLTKENKIDPWLSNCANVQLQVIPQPGSPSSSGTDTATTSTTPVINVIPPFSLTLTTQTTTPTTTPISTSNTNLGSGTSPTSSTPFVAPTTSTATQPGFVQPTSTAGATCPYANNTVYSNPSDGVQYLIRCEAFLSGTPLHETEAADLEACISECGTYSMCRAVTFYPAPGGTGLGTCILMGGYGTPTRASGTYADSAWQISFAMSSNSWTPVPSSSSSVIPTNISSEIQMSSPASTPGSVSPLLPPPITTLPGLTATGKVTSSGVITYVTTIGTSLVQVTTNGLVTSTQYASATGQPRATAAAAPSASVNSVPPGMCLVGKRVRALRRDEVLAKMWIDERI